MNAQMTQDQIYAFINESLDKLEKWRGEQLNLDAGCGLVGKRAGALHRDWLYSLSPDGYLHQRMHAGSIYYDDIEALCISLFQDVFHAKYVDLNPMSGANANIVLICALTKPGDTIMAFMDPLGHNSLRSEGIAGYLDRKVVGIPYDRGTLQVDLDAFRTCVRKERPSLIFLGSALYLFMEPFRQIRQIADEVGAWVCCDVSHTFGMLCSDFLPNPLDEGVDAIVGGTYKTFNGPCKGIILTNNETLYKLVHDTMPHIVSSLNSNYIPALTMALSDLKEYGNDYTRQLIANARALAKEMEARDFAVCFKEQGYTQTHLIAVKVDGTDRRGLVRQMESANILSSTVPCDDAHTYIRPGTLMVTRQGLVERDMATCAEFLHRALHLGEAEQVRSDIMEWMRGRSSQVHFAY